MVTDERLADVEVREQMPAVPCVFAGNEIDVSQNLDRPQGHVAEIADGGGNEHQGAGHGVDALRTLARHLIDERGHHRLTIDPSAANERAIRAYAKVGFRPVGTMRRYERGPDGTFHDGLLMDLLADELR